MCWPDALGPKRPTGVLDSGPLERVLRSLKKLQMDLDANGKPKPEIIPFSDRAAEVLQEWRVELAALENDLSGKLLSHVGKMPGMTARFSLILHYLQWATTDEPEPSEVDERFVKEAITLMKEYFIPMAERCYGEAGLPTAERDAVKIAKEIRKRQVDHLNASDLRRNWAMPGLRKADEVSAAVYVLEEANILKSNPNRLGDSKGRAKKDYLVNPKFLDAAYSGDNANGA